MKLNPNYNPNDPTSQRYINEAKLPTTPGQMLSSFVDPFKAIINVPTRPIIIPPAPAQNTGAGMSTININGAPMSTVPKGPLTPKAPVIPNAPIVPTVPPINRVGGSGAGPNQSVLAQQKALNAMGAGLVEDGLMGPKTQAAIAKYGNVGAAAPAKIPTTPSGAIDYAGLAKAAGAAGVSVEDYISMVKGQATPGTAEMDALYKELEIPGLVDEVFKKPSKTTQAIYEDYYKSTGLGDIKANIAELDKELKTIRDGYTQAQKEHQENPWLSASTRSARIAREKDLYGQKEANAIALRSSYLEQYNMGVGEIEKVVGRISGDLEKDRALNTDKLNYLLGEAERKAGLSVADATKTGLRYSSDFLTSKKKAADDKDTLAYKRQVALSDRQHGQAVSLAKVKAALDKANSVGAIVEKALKTNPTGSAYINGIQNALGANASEQGRNFALQTMANKVAAGDTKGAKEYLIGIALADDKPARANAIAANTVIDNLTAIKSRLNAYVEKTGDTNLLKGNIQSIQQKLGMAGDPEAAEIKSMITDNLQQVRATITGAAWGKSEDNEYRTTNANLNNSNRLNMALIDSAIGTADRKIDAAVGTIIGRDTYNQIFNAPSTPAFTETQVADYITKARSENIPDAEIEAYLISKGVSF